VDIAVGELREGGRNEMQCNGAEGVRWYLSIWCWAWAWSRSTDPLPIPSSWFERRVPGSVNSLLTSSSWTRSAQVFLAGTGTGTVPCPCQ
jgi:hypothetical protein